MFLHLSFSNLFSIQPLYHIPKAPQTRPKSRTSSSLCLSTSTGAYSITEVASFRQLRPSFVRAPLLPPLSLSPLYSPHGISARECGYPPIPSSPISTELVSPPQVTCLPLPNTTHGPPRKHSLTRFQLQITSEERHCDTVSSR